MKRLTIIVFLLLPLGAVLGQGMTCADFKQGNFYIETQEDQIRKYDVYRDGDTQVEFATSGEGENVYIAIEWINDCTYRLSFDPNYPLTETEQFINEVGGALVEMIKIEGNCFFYRSTIIVQGEDVIINGKICRK